MHSIPVSWLSLLQPQVITALMAHFTAGQPAMTLTAGSKVGAEYWGKSSGELEVLLHRGELLSGCMDKAQYGRHGLLHGIQVCALNLAGL